MFHLSAYYLVRLWYLSCTNLMQDIGYQSDKKMFSVPAFVYCNAFYFIFFLPLEMYESVYPLWKKRSGGPWRLCGLERIRGGHLSHCRIFCDTTSQFCDTWNCDKMLKTTLFATKLVIASWDQRQSQNFSSCQRVLLTAAVKNKKGLECWSLWRFDLYCLFSYVTI